MVLLAVTPVALQLAFCVVLKLSVSVPEKVAVLFTPVQVSGQLNRKQTLKLIAPVLLQADKLLIVIVSTPDVLVIAMQEGNTFWQLAS
jgi:hypothetical protein